jgi:hypothetical protein
MSWKVESTIKTELMSWKVESKKLFKLVPKLMKKMWKWGLSYMKNRVRKLNIGLIETPYRDNIRRDNGRNFTKINWWKT